MSNHEPVADVPLLDSHIAPEDPGKADVEAALRRLLESHGGAWRCRVDPSPNGIGWSLRLYNVADRSALTLVVRRALQKPDALVKWLGQVLERRQGLRKDVASDRRAERERTIA